MVFAGEFGNEFACVSLLCLLHHVRSYIYDLITICIPYRAERPCMEASSGRWARAESARFPARAGPFRGVARPPKAPPGRYGRVNGPVRDPARVGGANTYLVYAEVGSDRRTTSRRRRRRAREGRCDLSAPSTGSVLNKHTDHGRGVAKHVLDVAFLARWPGCP